MEKIIVAPRQMHKNLLFNSRKESLFVNPKIITKEELLDKYYGKVTKEGLYLLFKNHDIIYDNLMQLVPYISRANESCVRNKNIKLYELKKEVEEHGFLEKDEFFDQFIIGKEFEIYGYCKEDNELLSLLKKYNIKCEFKSFHKGNRPLSINNFPLIEDEIFYMLNSIADLLKNGVKPDDIFIYTSNENAIYYISKYYESFGFKINFPNSECLYSQEIVSVFLKTAKENKSFDVAFENLTKTEENQDIVNALVEACFPELDFDKKYDYVCALLKSRKLQNVRYENAVNIIDSPIFDENKYIFIPEFAQNIYPKSFKDSDYISDADKEELNVLTSLDKCRIEDNISKDFLLSNNIFVLSRSSASFSEKYFASPFVKSLNIKENNIKEIPDKLYSVKYGVYRLGIDEDKKHYFLQHSNCLDSLKNQINIDYANYHNDYTNADAFETGKELKLSYSTAKSYFQCPFSYYLDNVLEIKIEEDIFEARLGKLAHAVFENQFKDDFDFEETFENARKEFEWKPGENLLVDRLKNDIKAASDASILHVKKYAKNASVDTEKYLYAPISEHTKLIGYADKIIKIDDTDIIVIDYKTNNESFERSKIPYGLSLQLPTYAYLLSKSQKFENLHIAGLYINNVINYKFKSEKDDEDIIDSYLKLNGITVSNQESALKIDESLSNGKSFFIKGLSLKNGEFVKKGSSLAGDEELKQLQEDTLQKYLEADEGIRSNQFEISPLFLTSDGPCKFCKHKDICFLREEQKRRKENGEDLRCRNHHRSQPHHDEIRPAGSPCHA